MNPDRFIRTSLSACLILGVIASTGPVAAAEPPTEAAVAPATEPATATEPKALETPEERALEHFERSKTYFRSQQFALSIKESESAYALAPHPIYLFNIAQAHRRLRHEEIALNMYRRYLKEEPQHPDVGTRIEATNYSAEIAESLARQAQIDKEWRKPVYRKPWFWGVLASSAVAAGVVVGVGTYFGTRDPREQISFSGFGNSAMGLRFAAPATAR